MDKIDLFVQGLKADENFTSQTVAERTDLTSDQAGRLLELYAKQGSVDLIAPNSYAATQNQIALAAKKSALSGHIKYAVVADYDPPAQTTSSTTRGSGPRR